MSSNKYGRPDARIHFGRTGKPGTHTKKVTRDETGDMQIEVSTDPVVGSICIKLDRAANMLMLPPDKAYDFAHLILEHVKDRQGGEPVNVTEEKILAALTYAVATIEPDLETDPTASDIAALLLPEFMKHMAGEPAPVEDPVEEEDHTDAPDGTGP
jgi:hypothetical protein